MFIKKRYIIPPSISLIFALIHGIFIEPSLNIFLSWTLVGLWVDYVIKFFEKIKNYREFNSPHNTSFFVISVIFIGLFYLYSGYYTRLFNELLIDLDLVYVLLTPWITIFSFPFLLYGIYSLFACIRKYEVVYIYKERSVNARKFSIGFSIFILIQNMIFLILILEEEPILTFKPIFQYPDLIFLIITIFLVILPIYGVLKKEPSISDITPEAIASRRDQVRSIESAASRSSQSRPSRPTQRHIEPRSNTTSQRTKRKPQTKKKTKSKRKLSKDEIIKRIRSMKPKAGIFNLEDFKCIFCFNLPHYPQDKGRGIVLCPNCKHPAHADEFRDWQRHSNLCSRCDAEIPYSFRTNPKIIPVKSYVKVIEYFKKKENL
jgi:hypothetical protein